MKSVVPPHVLAPCVAYKLGQQFRDRRPTVDYYRGVHEITIDSPRGEKLAFVTVESDYAGGSTVSFWNGDLYWPNHITSGVWPDVMRDNWHRFEAAENACEPQPVAAKPVAKAKFAPAAAPTKPAPVKPITKAQPLKPLVLTPPAAATSTPSPAAATSNPAPAAATTTPPPAAATGTPPPPVTGTPPAAAGDPALLGS